MALLTGDIGGTKARLQVWNAGCSELLFRKVYRPADFPSLAACVAQAVRDAGVVPARAVLAVCGPVTDGRRKNSANNIREWYEPGAGISNNDAGVIEAAAGMAVGSLLFLNDFEAIGFALAAHADPAAPPAAKPVAPLQLHAGTPPPHPAVMACVGAGTGLGACFLVPIPHAPSNRYVVCPSEAGMIDALSPRTPLESDMLAWIRHRKRGRAPSPTATDADYTEVESIVSGPGLAEVYRYLVQAQQGGAALSASAAAVAAAVEAAEYDVAPAVVTAAAQGQAPAADGGAPDALALRAVDIFLTFYGRFCSAMAQTFLSYNGVFVAGGILPRLAWRCPSLSGAADAAAAASASAATGAAATPGAAAALPSAEVDPFLHGYLAAGPAMSDTVRCIPLLLLTDPHAGEKGCLYVAATPGAI